MKVKTLRTIINGKPVGSILDLPKGDAEYLIDKGLAEKVAEAPKKKAPAKKKETTTAKK